MNRNEIHLIHEDTYINHINEKIQMYSMVRQLAHMVKNLPSNRGSRDLSKMAAIFEKRCDEMFKEWNIPGSYLIFGDEDDLEYLMNEELARPEAVGYVFCDEDCDECCPCGECCPCCEIDEEDEEKSVGYEQYINYRGYNESLSDKKYMGALSNTYNQLKTKKELNVVYFGGSVTYGYGSEDTNQDGSWRVRVGRWLSEKFSKVKINNYNCAIGDTGTKLGFYRLDRDVISKNPDLVFIEFSINDYYEGVDYITASSQFESIIRRLKEALPECDIVTILVTDRIEASVAITTENDKGELKSGDLHLQARAHEYISKKYNLSSIHVGRALADEINNAGKGNISDEVWSEYVKDSVHPLNKGYDIYYKVIEEFLTNSLFNGELDGCKIVKQELPNPINLQLLSGDVTFIDDCDVDFTAKNGATYSPKAEGISDRWKEGDYKGVINFPNGSTDTLMVKFKGTELVMVMKSGLSDSNAFEVSIDDGKTWTICNYNTKNPTTILEGLPEKEHTAIIRPAYSGDVSVDCFYSRSTSKK